MEAHHSLDYTENFRVGGEEEREKSKGEKKREQREGGRENMTYPPFKYT